MQESRKECTSVSGELLAVGIPRNTIDTDGTRKSNPTYVEDDRLTILVRLEETGRIITAVAINSENEKLLARIAYALVNALEKGKPGITLCGEGAEEIREYITGYEFEFKSVTYWVVYRNIGYEKKVTVRTDFGDRLLDEVRDNWWDMFKGGVGKIMKALL